MADAIMVPSPYGPVELPPDVAAKLDELARLRTLLDSPQVSEFIEAVRVEAAHQVERYGAEHDQQKSPADWFWVLGWLGGKAVQAATLGDHEKALHHVITSAALLLNWHAQLSGVPRQSSGGSRG